MVKLLPFDTRNARSLTIQASPFAWHLLKRRQAEKLPYPQQQKKWVLCTLTFRGQTDLVSLKSAAVKAIATWKTKLLDHGFLNWGELLAFYLLISSDFGFAVLTWNLSKLSTALRSIETGEERITGWQVWIHGKWSLRTLLGPAFTLTLFDIGT